MSLVTDIALLTRLYLRMGTGKYSDKTLVIEHVARVIFHNHNSPILNNH